MTTYSSATECYKCGPVDRRAIPHGFLLRLDETGVNRPLCQRCASELDKSVRQAKLDATTMFFLDAYERMLP